jgi:hypothetical protein
MEVPPTTLTMAWTISLSATTTTMAPQEPPSDVVWVLKNQPGELASYRVEKQAEKRRAAD